MGLLWLTYLETFMVLVSFGTFAVRTAYLYIKEKSVCQIYKLTISFPGPYRDSAQFMLKTRMDNGEGPFGLQDGPFSFSMVG